MKANVLVYGNCQAQWLAEELSKHSDIVEVFDVHYQTSLGAIPKDSRVLSPDFVAACSHVFWQAIVGLPAPPILAALPRDCVQFRFPNVQLKLLWPLTALDPRNQMEPDYPIGRYPYGDWLIMRYLLERVPTEDIVKRYIETDINPFVNFDRHYELVFAEMQAMDKNADISLCSFIESKFRDRRLFGTISHPSILVMSRILCQLECILLGKTAPDPSPIPTDAEDIMGTEEIPLHPQICSHYRLQWVKPGMKYRYRSAFLTFEEYFRAYAAFDAIPLGDSPSLWVARARQFYGWGEIAEAKRLLASGCKVFPELKACVLAFNDVMKGLHVTGDSP